MIPGYQVVRKSGLPVRQVSMLPTAVMNLSVMRAIQPMAQMPAVRFDATTLKWETLGITAGVTPASELPATASREMSAMTLSVIHLPERPAFCLTGEIVYLVHLPRRDLDGKPLKFYPVILVVNRRVKEFLVGCWMGYMLTSAWKVHAGSVATGHVIRESTLTAVRRTAAAGIDSALLRNSIPASWTAVSVGMVPAGIGNLLLHAQRIVLL